MQSIIKLLNNDDLKTIKLFHNNYKYYIKQIKELKSNKLPIVQFKDFKQEIINSKHFNLYVEMLQNIKTEQLYQSDIHGINHNLRVSLFAFYLANKLQLSQQDVQLIIYASFYHDVGRRNDCEDNLHGELSAKKIDSLNLHLTDKDTKILKAIITGHSLPDQNFNEVMNEYHIQDKQRCEKLFSILKDADALDRVRLEYPYIKIDLIRNYESKQLIPLAFLIEHNYNILKKSSHKIVGG